MHANQFCVAVFSFGEPNHSSYHVPNAVKDLVQWGLTHVGWGSGHPVPLVHMGLLHSVRETLRVGYMHAINHFPSLKTTHDSPAYCVIVESS